MSLISPFSLLRLEQLTKSSARIAELILRYKLHMSSRLTGQPATGVTYPQKFEMASKFVFSIKDVLAITDRHSYGPLYLWYHGIRYIMQHAFTDHPVPGINYSKVLISRGYLWNTSNAQAKAAKEEVLFEWVDDSGTGSAKPNDQCILVAYCPALDQCIFSAESAERRLGKATLAVPEFRGHQVQTWLGFMSANGNQVANSVHTGAITVT